MRIKENNQKTANTIFHQTSCIITCIFNQSIFQATNPSLLKTNLDVGVQSIFPLPNLDVTSVYQDTTKDGWPRKTKRKKKRMFAKAKRKQSKNNFSSDILYYNIYLESINNIINENNKNSNS